MNKRHIHHVLKQLKKLSAWYFVVAILVSLGVSVAAMRQNNITALQLRDTVLEVDKQNGDVETALRELRSYVYSHMNTNLTVENGAYPPVQLKYRYDRLAAAEKERVSAVNAQLYTEAQAFCEATIPTGRSAGRIECIQDYLTSKGAVVEQPIQDALYKFAFASPVWSSDLAGWSIVLTAVLVLTFITRFITIQFFKHRLND